MGNCQNGGTKTEKKDNLNVGTGGNTIRPYVYSSLTLKIRQTNLFKFLIIGDAGVGKTSLAAHWIDGSFANAYIATIGVDFKVKKVEVGGSTVKIQVWDTAGQERYNTITSTYYRGCQGVLVVYDVTDRQSFQNVKKWISDIEKYTEATNELTVVLVGNKADQESRKVVPTREANEFCKSKPFMIQEVIEASAKSGTNVDKAFMDLANTVHSKLTKE